MADVLTKEQRHKCMSHIRSTNTKPEILVRKFLFSKGFRYSLNSKKLPGKPDIVLRKYKTVIFVNGCFWHGHEGCSLFVVPKSNTQFWLDKINHNIERDAIVHAELEKLGWKVIVVWQCELKTAVRENTLNSIVSRILGE